MKAEPLCRVGGRLLEGPAWTGWSLRFVDIHGCERLMYDPAVGGLERTAMTATPSAWIDRRTGGSLVACRHGLYILDPEGAVQRVVRLEAEVRGNRSNDAKCDPRGRLWVGTMREDTASPDGALYRVEGDEVTRVLGDVTISNGLGWSPDERFMYYIDTPTRRIDVFDYDIETGTASSRRILADVRELTGVPDGLAVDAEGGVWVAFYDGAVVRRFSPEGEFVGSVGVGATRPTSCAFIGPDLDQLAITTAAAPDGTGGDLFVCDPGVRGLPVAAYAD